MNIVVPVSFQIMVFLWIYAQEGITRSCDISIFTILRSSILFSIQVVTIHVLTNSVQGFSLLHSLSSIFTLKNIIRRFFEDGCSDQCEVILHCSFHLQFSNY